MRPVSLESAVRDDRRAEVFGTLKFPGLRLDFL